MVQGSRGLHDHQSTSPAHQYPCKKLPFFNVAENRTDKINLADKTTMRRFPAFYLKRR
jgi:hypothetical protein